ITAGGRAVAIDLTAGYRPDKGAFALKPGHVHDDQGQARLVVGLGAGILPEELAGGDLQAGFQAQDIIGSGDNGGGAATLGEAGLPRVAAESEAALRG